MDAPTAGMSDAAVRTQSMFVLELAEGLVRSRPRALETIVHRAGPEPSSKSSFRSRCRAGIERHRVRSRGRCSHTARRYSPPRVETRALAGFHRKLIGLEELELPLMLRRHYPAPHQWRKRMARRLRPTSLRFTTPYPTDGSVLRSNKVAPTAALSTRTKVQR